MFIFFERETLKEIQGKMMENRNAKRRSWVETSEALPPELDDSRGMDPPVADRGFGSEIDSRSFSADVPKPMVGLAVVVRSRRNREMNSRTELTGWILWLMENI